MKNSERIVLTKKDLRKTWNLWYLQPEVAASFERLQALGFAAAMTHSLKKLYPNKEDYSKALQRHLQFFNTEGIFGGVIHGITLSLEEQKANGEPIDEQMITSIKTGLMGPMAGIGDTLTWATMKPLFYSIGVTFAMEGSILGAFLPLVFALVTYIIGYNGLVMGYTTGKESVSTMLKGGMINKAIKATSILGLFMMGALSATYVKLSTPLQFTLANSKNPIVIQEILDSIVPGILPLAVVMGIYWYLKTKGRDYTKIVLILIASSLLGAAVGIF